LHAKTFAVDRDRVFVGSFNFDQRSARLNTEMGLVIASPALAQRLAAAFDTNVPRVAYEVRLTPDGENLEWIERTAAGETRYDTEPGTDWWLRTRVDMLSILPIEWLL
jgi:putative cardiolipin synthase